MLPIVVLSGGLATRLRPLTEKIPKSLIEVNGIPFVFHQLELFNKNKFEKIHFCLGYLGEMVEEAIRASKFASLLEITFSYDGEKLLGTGGAVKKSFPYIWDNFFITYGDSYLEINFELVEEFYFSSKMESRAVMVVYKNNGQFDKSNAIFENGNLLYSKRNPTKEMSYIDYGVGILNKPQFKDYPAGESFDLSDIYEKLSREGNLMGYEVYNRFFEIGSLNGIEDISKHLLK